MRHSATSVQTVCRCARKAAFKYTTDLPQEPYTQATSLGVDVHALLEGYVKLGTPPVKGRSRADDLAFEALKWVARPRTGHVEAKTSFEWLDHQWLMFIDYTGQVKDVPKAPADFDPEDPANVDYKTSSNPKAYGIGFGNKCAQTDLQANIYAAFYVAQGAQRVFNRWIYIDTKSKKPRVLPSDFVLTADTVRENFETTIIPAANLMAKIRGEHPDPNTIDANPDACRDFNRGCWYGPEYLNKCTLSQEQQIFRLAPAQPKGNETMGMPTIAEIRARAEGKTSAPAPTTTGAGINPPPAPAVSTLEALKAQLAAAEAEEAARLVAEAEAKAQAEREAAQAAAPAPVQAETPAPADGKVCRVGLALLELIAAIEASK